MKKYKLSSLLLSLIVFSCTGNNPPVTLPIPSTSNTPGIIVSTQPTATPVPTPTSVIKPYEMPDIKSNFIISDQIQLSNFVPTVLDDNGNGMIVFKGNALKISNFKPSGEKLFLDTDFGEAAITLDEKGNGLIIWGREPVGTTGNEIIPPEFFYFKYIRIKDYKPFGEAIKINNNSEYNLSTNARFNLDDNGNGRMFYISRFNESIKVTTFPVREYLISETKEKSVNFEGQNIYLDKNGNGLLSKVDINWNIIFFKIENLVQQKQEMKLNNKEILSDSYNLSVDFDINGNGYISWTYPYSQDVYSNINRDKGELIIKKLSGFNLIGDEISLGTDYGPGNSIKLDQNGNGIVFWIRNFPKADIYVREIKNYIPENPVIIENNNDFKVGYELTTNKFGDGFITWEATNYQNTSSFSKYYGRLISNYTISKDGAIPINPLPKPTPLVTLIPIPPPYIFTPDGKPIEIGTVHGILKDNNGNLVSGATVKIKSQTNSSIEIPEQITIDDGSYLIRNVPIGSIEITVSKTGYKTISRTVVNESNQAGDPAKNTFDFIGNFSLVKE